jgi:hypothetical protein
VLPGVPYLLIDPPGPYAAASPGRLYPAEEGDPLLADVDLSDVHVARAENLAHFEFGRPVIDSTSGPVLEVQDSPTRAGVISFDLHESDLPLRAAFPLLVSNLSEFLDPPSVPAAPVAPGVPVVIAAGPGSVSVSVTRPDNKVQTLSLGSGQTTVIDPDTSEVGFYQVTTGSSGRPPAHDEFVVNVGGSSGSAYDVAPQEHMALSGTAASAPASHAPTQHELWWWIALAALAVLLVEWGVYLRVT